jgi:hypothetical protein
MPQFINDIETRISPLFPITVKIDGLLRYLGLGLPMRLIAWVAGRSVQMRVKGRWQTIVTPVDEVLADAFR